MQKTPGRHAWFKGDLEEASVQSFKAIAKRQGKAPNFIKQIGNQIILTKTNNILADGAADFSMLTMALCSSDIFMQATSYAVLLTGWFIHGKDAKN